MEVSLHDASNEESGGLGERGVLGNWKFGIDELLETTNEIKPHINLESVDCYEFFSWECWLV